MTETELTLIYTIWCSFFGIDSNMYKYFFLMGLVVFISSHVGSKNMGKIENDYLWTERLIKLKRQLYRLRHYINGIHCQICKSIILFQESCPRTQLWLIAPYDGYRIIGNTICPCSIYYFSLDVQALLRSFVLKFESATDLAYDFSLTWKLYNIHAYS
jgi:hypothetical protein